MKREDILNKIDDFFDNMSEAEFKNYMIDLSFKVVSGETPGISYEGEFEFSLE